MVFYICPNCNLKSLAYKESLLHYQSCTITRTRSNSSLKKLHLNSTVPLTTLRLNTTAINSLFQSAQRNNLSSATLTPLPPSPAMLLTSTSSNTPSSSPTPYSTLQSLALQSPVKLDRLLYSKAVKLNVDVEVVKLVAAEIS